MTWPGTVPYTTKDRDRFLDLERGIGVRTWSFEFLHYNGVTGQNYGDLNPYISGAQLQHDTSRTIKRQVSLELDVADTEAINPLTDRIAINMIVRNNTRFPLGKYMFTDNLQRVSTGGNQASVQLLDEMFIVDQQISTAFTASQVNCTNAIVKLLQGIDIPFDIESSPFLADNASSIGTQRGQILETLATQGDYQTPWLDNHGTLRMIRTIDPATAPASIDFDTEKRIIADTITRTTDILNAPNRFIVVSNSSGASNVEVVGQYDVPASAPHSIQSRGFIIPKVVDAQLDSNSQAVAAARNIGLRQTIVERASFTAMADPRHDSYDVCIFDGAQWMELAWTLDLTPGGNMTHTIAKAYL